MEEITTLWAIPSTHCLLFQLKGSDAIFFVDCTAIIEKTQYGDYFFEHHDFTKVQKYPTKVVWEDETACIEVDIDTLLGYAIITDKL